MKKLRNKLNRQNITTIVYPVLFGVFIAVLWQTELLHKIVGADTFTLPLPKEYSES